MANYWVTGANRGIGLALCQRLLGLEHRVFAVCRQACAALRALPLTVIDNVDICHPHDISRLLETVSKQPIDVLINNAGVWGGEGIVDLDLDKLKFIMETNAIAPLLLTKAVLPFMAKSGKVVLMSSRMGSIGDNEQGGGYGYRMSKAALNAAGKSLSIDLKQHGIAVGILHPGHVATDMGGPQGRPVDVVAQEICRYIETLNLDNSGIFMRATGETLPW